MPIFVFKVCQDSTRHAINKFLIKSTHREILEDHLLPSMDVFEADSTWLFQ